MRERPGPTALLEHVLIQTLDGFKRLRAARALGWPTVAITIAEVADGVEAKVRLVELHHRNGVSFYAHDRICAELELTLDDYLAVRDRLIDLDLVAFDGTQFQVLSLPPAPSAPPPRPLVTQDDFEDHDPATIRRLLRSSLDRRR